MGFTDGVGIDKVESEHAVDVVLGIVVGCDFAEAVNIDEGKVVGFGQFEYFLPLLGVEKFAVGI